MKNDMHIIYYLFYLREKERYNVDFFLLLVFPIRILTTGDIVYNLQSRQFYVAKKPIVELFSCCNKVIEEEKSSFLP